MRRGARPDFTLLRPPANEHTTAAQQWYLDQILDLEPGSDDTDSGGYAHKPGYHDTVAHNDARSGKGKDYSARDAQDRRGPHDKTRARDWGFTPAWSGDYRRIELYGDRVMAAYRAADPRLRGWREYLGRVSAPVLIDGRKTRRVGIDFRYRFLRIPDSSHDTHVHKSENTEHVESYQNKWAMLTVLAGWTVQEWQQSLDEEIEMATPAEVWKYGAREYVDQDDNGVRDSRTALDILWSTHSQAVHARSDLARVIAGQEALLVAVQGGSVEQVLAEVRRVGEDVARRGEDEIRRDAELLDLVRQWQSGQLDADAVLTRMGERLTAPAGTPEPR
jgi:hypothetical protein